MLPGRLLARSTVLSLTRSVRRRASTAQLRPDEVVQELDKWIVGQRDAKVAVAIALRDRWRRQRLPNELQAEVLPNNILMIGPTGVGKTEIARRLAKLASAPFVKVEATKYTEVGFHGQDTESMVCDLVDAALVQVEQQAQDDARPAARAKAEARIAIALCSSSGDENELQSLEKMVHDGHLDEKEVEIEATPTDERVGLPLGASGGLPPELADLFKGLSKGRGMGATPSSISIISADDIFPPPSGKAGGGNSAAGGGKEPKKEKKRMSVAEVRRGGATYNSVRTTCYSTAPHEYLPLNAYLLPHYWLHTVYNLLLPQGETGARGGGNSSQGGSCWADRRRH